MLVCVCRWFAGRVSRLEAEKRLRWQDTGVFLVRESESAPGEFSVSVRSVNAHTHTRETSLTSRPSVVYSHIVMVISSKVFVCWGAAAIFACVESAALLSFPVQPPSPDSICSAVP